MAVLGKQVMLATNVVIQRTHLSVLLSNNAEVIPWVIESRPYTAELIVWNTLSNDDRPHHE